MADFEENVEEMLGTTREARVATESGGDETGGLGCLGDETGDKMVATTGDERDDGDRWGNVYERRGVRI